MKKSIVFILCLMLAFAGCANGNSTQPETVPPHMYTLEDFSSLVEGESDLEDINDIIATDYKMGMLATSYGGLLKFPLEDGGYVQIRMYMQNGEMIVGKITTDTAQAEAVPTNPYSLTNAVGNPFGKLDAAYDRAHTAAETTEQLYAVEDTYLAYWKAEVQKEFVLLKSVLDAETAARLDTAQAAWEAQVNESIQLEYDILASDNGTALSWQSRSALRAQYRERAFRLYYLNTALNNTAVSDAVNREIATFRASIDPTQTVEYTALPLVRYATDDLISIEIRFTVNAPSAAHPSDETSTFNWSLKQQKQLYLKDIVTIDTAFVKAVRLAWKEHKAAAFLDEYTDEQLTDMLTAADSPSGEVVSSCDAEHIYLHFVVPHALGDVAIVTLPH